MTHRVSGRVMLAYGLAVGASGLYRYISQEGGEKGLWFGLVMGSLGCVSGLALASGRTRSGYAGSLVTLLLVGGWFGYEVCVLKGLANAEIRQILILAASLAVACAHAVSSVRPRAIDASTYEPTPE